MAAAPASAVIHIIFLAPCIAIDNAMASRVFRVVALRYIRESPDPMNPVVFTTAIYSCDMDNSTKQGCKKSCGDVERENYRSSQRV